MPKPDFSLKFIKDANGLRRLSETLISLPAFALDIETTEWWNRQREQIALIQIAFRTESGVKVFIIDALADFDPNPLRLPLEESSAVKVIHNAGFDAARLNKHYDFNLNPVFDTMLAARRGGERKYSLKAQAEIHLALLLDKAARASDWSRRPLDNRQLYYAASDPYATLLLYENQTLRRLDGSYRLKPVLDTTQNLLPLDDLTPPVKFSAITTSPITTDFSSSPADELPEEAMALLRNHHRAAYPLQPRQLGGVGRTGTRGAGGLDYRPATGSRRRTGRRIGQAGDCPFVRKRIGKNYRVAPAGGDRSRNAALADGGEQQ